MAGTSSSSTQLVPADVVLLGPHHHVPGKERSDSQGAVDTGQCPAHADGGKHGRLTTAHRRGQIGDMLAETSAFRRAVG